MSSVEDIVELFVLVSLLAPGPFVFADLLLPVELFMLLLPVVDELFMLPLVEPVPVVERSFIDEPVFEPLTVPLERVVLPLVVPVAPVLDVVPALGPEFGVLLVGEPEAPPWPPPLVPAPWARAPPHANAAAAERARILKVCLMG